MKTDNPMLEQAIFGLLEKLPWYGCLIQSMKVVISRDLPTAGVRFDNNGTSVRLSVNPDFLASLTPNERIALLIHEASHVDRLHLIRIPQATTNLRLGNIAADAAINCYIPDLPKGGIYPKDFNLKNYQTFEYYLERLTDDKNESKRRQGTGRKPKADPNGTEGQSAAGQGEPTDAQAPGQSAAPLKRYVSPEVDSLDVHDWENSGLAVSDQAEIIENIMKRAIEKMGLDAGQLPSHVAESLKLLRELKTKKWHKELRRFLGRTVNGYGLERTWSRRNRRFGLLEAGSKISGQKKLAVAFDTSGSMSQTELNQMLAETMAMVKSGVIGHLIQFDTQINDITRLKRSDLAEVKVCGRGGTSFQDLFSKVDALHCDAVIVFTDGQDSGTCEKPKTPVLWVYTAGINTKYDWGFKTEITENKA